MDKKFTEEMCTWLNTPDEERDYKASALLLLKIPGNQIMYLNNIRNPEGCRERVSLIKSKSITTSVFSTSLPTKFSKSREDFARHIVESCYDLESRMGDPPHYFD